MENCKNCELFTQKVSELENALSKLMENSQKSSDFTRFVLETLASMCDKALMEELEKKCNDWYEERNRK